MVKGEVPVAEEARPPPQILLGFAPGVGVNGVGGISREVRRQVPPPAPVLGAPIWLARRHGHPEVVEPSAARHVHVPPSRRTASSSRA
jgi:hypothetical protein